MIDIIASGSTGSSSIPWYQVATGVIAIPAALLTIYGGVVLSRKTRLESRKLELDIAAAEGKQVTDSGSMLQIGSSERTPRAIVASVEGYVIRFILLYLTFEIVGFLLSAINPLLGFSVLLFRRQPIAVQYVIGVSGTYLDLLVNIVVFLALGLPLFKDILGSLGLRPSEIFSREIRKQSTQKNNVDRT